MIVVVSFYPVCCVIVGILFWHTYVMLLLWSDLILILAVKPLTLLWSYVVKFKYISVSFLWEMYKLMWASGRVLESDFLVFLFNVQQKQSDVIENRSKVIGVLAAQRGFCSQTN